MTLVAVLGTCDILGLLDLYLALHMVFTAFPPPTPQHSLHDLRQVIELLGDSTSQMLNWQKPPSDISLLATQ